MRRRRGVLRTARVTAAVSATALLAALVGCSDDGGGASDRPRESPERTTTTTGGDRTSTTAGPESPVAGAEPLLVDEFDVDGAPDPLRWEVVEERRHDASLTVRPRNVRVEDGVLVIEAHREDFRGERFTSAMLRSREEFRFGRFEARMRMPTGRGTWPAFWLSAWPDDAEIDVVEHYARDAGDDDPDRSGLAHSNLHSAPPDDDPEDTSQGRKTSVPVDPDEWHVYAVDWAPGEIRFSVDGEVTATHRAGGPGGGDTWTFDDHDQHLVLDLFLGGQAGPVDAGALPQRLLVDWVRATPLPD